MLAAHVSLVASGVGKGCTPENLKEFLAGKGINAVEVVMLTKPDVIDQVRTLTFRVAVKPEDYEAALNPGVWPYRVGVRHFKAPRRERTESSWQGQAERTGGYVDHGGAGAAAGGRGGGAVGAYGGQGGTRPKQFIPPGHAGQGGKHQQQLGQLQPGPIELSNMFSLLLGAGFGQPNP